MNYLAIFFAGAFLCNSIPHLSSGLMGLPFPSPFSKPMGIGDSPPIVNFIWGFFNLLVGIFLFSRHPAAPGFNPEFATLVAGILLMGMNLSTHFGKVQRSKSSK
jgi:hypothetical protein